jgi:Taurine catabolism dioxygenase TauD, TfdA family
MTRPTTPSPTTARRRTPGATWSAHGPGPRPAQGLPSHGLPQGPGRYEVGNLRQARVLERLPRQVADEGLAVFDGVDDAAGLMAAAVTVMTVFAHPDADPDGVTTIADLGPAGDHPGAAGFSHRGLPAHTDRSGVPTPPALVMVTCAAGFFTGGASLLTDGAAVYTDLAATAPATLEALHRPRSALFGGSAGYLGAVLTPEDLTGLRPSPTRRVGGVG